MKRCVSVPALLALFLAVAACSGEKGITEPTAPVRPIALEAIGIDPVSGATIETNKDDYSPGEVVHVDGHGWTPGETVTLFMTEQPDTHGDVTKTVQADATGKFSLHYYDVQPHDLGVTFTLTATGGTSHSVAVATFTDNLPILTFTMNGSLTVTVAPGGTTVNAVVTGNVNTGGGNNTLGSIAVKAYVDGTSPATAVLLKCEDVPNQTVTTGSDPFSASFTFVAPSAANTYDIIVQTYGTNNCTTPVATLTRDNGIVVQAVNTAPTLAAIGNKSTDEGGVVSFDANGSDIDSPAQTLTYSISPSVPSGASFNTSTGVFSWTTNDGPAQSTTLTVRVTDNGSPAKFAEETITITVNNVAPSATFNAPVSVSGGSPINISLTAPVEPSSVDAGSLQYAFDCGSGTFGPLSGTTTASCPTSGGSGSVNVRGKIRDKDGGENIYSKSVAINNVAPLANILLTTYAGNEGSGIAVSGTGSDPDGGSVSYEWTVTGSVCSIANADQPSATVTCTDNGSFTLTLKVTDDETASTTDNATLDVANVKPTATFNAPASVNEGSPINLSLSGATDVSTTDLAAGLTFAFDCGSGYGGFSSTSSASCPTTDEGTRTVKGTVRDKDGGSTEYTDNVTINNVAPVLSVGAATATLDEGSTFTRGGSFSDPGTDSWTATVDYGDGSGSQPLALAGKTFSLSRLYSQDGTYTVTVSVNDGDGGADTETITVTVNNVAPVLSVGASTATLDEGSTFSRSGSFTDPGDDTWTATVNYGDGSGNQSLALTGKTFNLSKLYAQDGVYTVTVAVDDNDGGVDTETITVTVNNVLPVVTAGPSATAIVNEGSAYTQNGSFTDPGADTWTATVDYGEGAGPQSLALSGKNFTLNNIYDDDDGGPFTITVKVYDDDGSALDQLTITVNNVGPVINTPLVLPVSPVATGTNFSMSWTFTDPGADSWLCRISWDNAPINLGAPFASSGHTCTVSGSSLPAGVYTVTVYVEDDDGGSDQETATAYIVVYDPGAGFVTGGGWIMSPLNAYAADPSLTGKANFGFVSKYQQGKNTPDGNTEFQFHAGSLNFKSTSYEWLVVAGSKAQYKGEGTIAGQSGVVFGFMITAIDGGTADQFRIKIWNKATSAVVYDNKMGSSEDSDAATALGGGSIVVHTKK